MPYIMGNYIGLYQFLRSQSQWYQYSDRVWVQHIDRINKCTAFTATTIEIDDCDHKNPFICEIGTYIKLLPQKNYQEVIIKFFGRFERKLMHIYSAMLD